jgi:hypothetical protein
MPAQKFRKRPVEVDAVRYTEETAEEILVWLGRPGGADELSSDWQLLPLVVNTLEGDLTASPGDWIIRGVQREFYACKPDIFDSTYEPSE